MYVIKDKEGNIIAISNDLDYQENGNPLIHNGTLAIAEILVDKIEETDTIPENWAADEEGRYYRTDFVHKTPDEQKTPDELRQEGAEAVTAELIERGIL